MKFVPSVEYSLSVNVHSRTMLAIRYGIACEADRIPCFFDSHISEHEHNSVLRQKNIFNIEGQRVRAITQDDMLITVIPSSKVFSSPDVSAISTAFDIALSMDSSVFTMQEIADWMDHYFDANGGLSKDDLRRDILKRSPSYRDPMEVLGLHDSFFEEVRELRQIVEKECRERVNNAIDFSSPLDKDELKKSHRIFELAKTERTLLRWETKEYQEQMLRDWERFQSSDEYHQDMLAYQEDLRKELQIEELSRGRDAERDWNAYIESGDYKRLSEFEKASKKRSFDEYMITHNKWWLETQRRLETESKEWESFKKTTSFFELSEAEKAAAEADYQALILEINPLEDDHEPQSHTLIAPEVGIPSGGKAFGSFRNQTVYFHENFEVTDIVMNDFSGGWHEIHYSDGVKSYITTTKHRFIAESYEIGVKGVWTVSYDNGRVNYIQPFGGGDDRKPEFIFSPEYLSVRYEALKRSNGKCQLCGSRDRLEVDHIKPISLYPKLQLEISNLQVLCHQCNSGKSNTDQTDFRS